MHLFTPSVTTDINLVCLRETAQVLLRYILSHHLRLTLIRSSRAVTYTNNSGLLASATCRSIELAFLSRTHFLRNVIISYPVQHKLFELYHHISQVRCFLGIFVPNWPMQLTVPLDKVIFFSLLHKHWQDCARSVDVSITVISFPDLEVRR